MSFFLPQAKTPLPYPYLTNGKTVVLCILFFCILKVDGILVFNIQNVVWTFVYAGRHKKIRKDWNWMERISSWYVLTMLIYLVKT